MTQSTIPISSPGDLSLRAILGLRDDSDQDWDRIRAIQLRGLSRYRVVRTAANLVLGLMVVQIFSETVPNWALALWSVALFGVTVFPIYLVQTGRVPQLSHVSVQQCQKLASATILSGAIWALPMVFFVPYGSVADLAAMWTILAALVIASVVLLNALPLGTILFNLVVMGASLYTFWQTDHMMMIGAVCAFSIMLVMATVENARAFLMLKLNEAGLAEKNEVVSLLLREFEEGEADWLWQIDTARRVEHASPRFAFAAGREAGEVNGMSFLQLISGSAWESGNFPPSLHQLAEKLKQRESFSNLVVRVSIAGKTRWWELSASPKINDDGSFAGFRGVGSDVTESRENSEKIARMARFDNLTGLPNRLQLTEALNIAMRDAERWNGRCGMMMIDLDRFKSVNDTLGHLVGDRLLAMVSQRLRSLTRKGELCGRLGGDEFAVIIHDATDGARIDQLASQIIEVLSRPYDVDQHTLYIGASIGTAIGPRDGRTVETLMRSADLALYRSKDDGGGTHNRYEPKLHVDAEERRVMEIALRKALEKDEFTLSYQPVVDSTSEGIVAFEALLRWNSGDFGPVSPAKFIPLAEEARLVVPIGNWVLHRACVEAIRWPESVKVAVNVSAEQLYEPDFVETVVEALSESGLPPQRLELEVTESVFLREGSDVCKTLDNILALGVGLALDDFGTGYSALGYLSKTRFTTIKVDRSFVQGAAKDLPESVAIIRAVVAMADSLGMSTTAEGVESEHEVEIVRGLGCKKIQGYFYGRPMSDADVMSLFDDYRTAKLA
ncbi:MAG: EAL domain-containing protein [Blastomonas sp.]